MSQEVPSIPDDDRPRILPKSGDIDPGIIEENIRRKNATDVAHRTYPYDVKGTSAQNSELTRQREQAISSGPDVIEEAEKVVENAIKRNIAAHAVADVHLSDLEAMQEATDAGVKTIDEAEGIVRQSFEDLTTPSQDKNPK